MEEIKSKVKAIIFDMDGTIINTEQAWKNVTIDVLKARGFTTFTPEQEMFLDSLSGTSLPIAVDKLKQFFNLPHPTEELIEHKIQLARHYLSQDVFFIEGFESFHKRLQTIALPTSIATNASPETLIQMEQKLKLSQFFGKNLYCSADVGFKAKPDPAVFLHAAQQLGAMPNECIVFEDSIPGFQAAKAAGMRCIAIKNNINKHFLDQVTNAINSYHEAEEVLKKL
jgi:beta-phosphoglucomutase-like phosphatase (HAD superfamily)